jgi:predicted helicase
MKHMLKENIALTVGRQGKVVGESTIWNLAFVSDKVVDLNMFYRGGELVLPLYLYLDDKNRTLFNHKKSEKQANLSNKIVEKLATTLNNNPSSEKILFYIYAVIYSNVYRVTYDEFLKVDYPRIPFTTSTDVFNIMADLGHRLVDLHLLQSTELDQPTVKFQGQGEDLTVGRRLYDEETGRVYINKDYYFEGVSPEVWAYQIGGYQVMDKYLKDRKGRRMEDPRHYIHIATALEKTIEIQAEIDAIYPEVEKDLIEF